MWALVISVVLHKSLIAFSLGLSGLYHYGLFWLPFSAFNVFLYIRNVVYVMLIFVSSSPLGALLGALLKEKVCQKTVKL